MSQSQRSSNDAYRSLRRHDKYYLNGGDLFLLAGQEIFRIHRYFFERDSEYWAGRLQPGVAPGSERIGTSDSNAIVLEDVGSNDLATFLWVFYNPKYSLYNTGVDDWETILSLATFWSFREAKALAVRELEKLWMEDVDRVVLYHENNVDRRLLIPRYIALTDRPEPLSIEEGMRLGLETALTLAKAREVARSTSVNGAGGESSPSGLKKDDLRDLIMELFSVRPVSRGSESPPQGDRTSMSPLYSDAQGGRGLTSVQQALEPHQAAPMQTPLSRSRPIQMPTSPLRPGPTPWVPLLKTPRTPLVLLTSPTKPNRRSIHPIPPTTPSCGVRTTTSPRMLPNNPRAAQEMLRKKPPPPPPLRMETGPMEERKRREEKSRIVTEDKEVKLKDEESRAQEVEGKSETEFSQWSFGDGTAEDVVDPSAPSSHNDNLQRSPYTVPVAGTSDSPQKTESPSPTGEERSSKSANDERLGDGSQLPAETSTTGRPSVTHNEPEPVGDGEDARSDVTALSDTQPSDVTLGEMDLGLGLKGDSSGGRKGVSEDEKILRGQEVHEIDLGDEQTVKDFKVDPLEDHQDPLESQKPDENEELQNKAESPNSADGAATSGET